MVESFPAGLVTLQPTDMSLEGDLTSLWLLYNLRTARKPQMRDEDFAHVLLERSYPLIS